MSAWNGTERRDISEKGCCVRDMIDHAAMCERLDKSEIAWIAATAFEWGRRYGEASVTREVKAALASADDERKEGG